MAEDDEKAELARQGLALVERAEGASAAGLAERVKGAAADAAGSAILGGMAALNELTGGKKSDARPRPSAAAVDAMHARLDAANVAEYDERLARAASRYAKAKRAADAIVSREAETVAARRARLRRSFPAESKELALLVFACADLIDEVAAGDPPPEAELRKSEALLRRIAALLGPHAGPALDAFVAHVVALSRTRDP